MKKLFVFAAAAIFAAALAVSCQNIEVVSDVQHDYRTATIVLPDPGSKLAISETDGKVAWEVGDVINIHGKAISEMQTYTLKAEDISADGRSAVITYDAATMEKYGVDDYYAQYPAGAVKVFMSGSSASHYAEFNNTNLPLMAAYLKDGAFNFRNLCGIISFKVTGDFDSYAFSGNNDEVVGYSQYAIKHTSEETYTKDESSGEILVLKGAVATDGTTANLLCIPGGKEFTEGFTIKLLKGDTIVKVAKTTKSIEVGRSDLLPLGDITSVLVDYVPETHQNKITDATNLGATETANCYIIDKAGSYKIPAVKGNSNESVGSVAGVKLLWETYCTDTAPEANSIIAAVDYEEDAVFFKTPESLQPGNALIAATDAEQNILWSWHIWIPSTTITDTDASLFGIPAMSRNLGALIDATGGDSAEEPAAGGLFYQYGRKDPFPGCSVFDVNQDYGCPKIAMSISFPKASGTPLSIDESIANPTLFTYNGETVIPAEGKYDGQNWCSEGDNQWGGTDDKTIYDPCPPGYKVPALHEDMPVAQSDGWTPDYTKHWYKKSSVVFPHAGYLDDCDGGMNYAGSRSKVWYATIVDDKVANCIYSKKNEAVKPTSSSNRASGASVRCVKIGTPTAPSEPEPDPEPQGPVSITIDGDMADWADVTGATNGNHQFKVASDETNIYFYSFRSTGSRYSEIWGGGGYIYVGFTLDNDTSNDVTLNGKGPYDFVFYVTPYGGSADSPAIADDFLTLGYGADCLPKDETYKVSNIVGKGVITDAGVAVEFSIPRADMPKIPETAITVESVGNKDLAKVTLSNKLL